MRRLIVLFVGVIAICGICGLESIQAKAGNPITHAVRKATKQATNRTSTIGRASGKKLRDSAKDRKSPTVSRATKMASHCKQTSSLSTPSPLPDTTGNGSQGNHRTAVEMMENKRKLDSIMSKRKIDFTPRRHNPPKKLDVLLHEADSAYEADDKARDHADSLFWDAYNTLFSADTIGWHDKMTLAALKGSPKAQFYKGWSVLDEDTTSYGRSVGLYYIEHAANRTEPNACSMMSEYYEKGLYGYPVDAEAASEWASKYSKPDEPDVEPVILQTTDADTDAPNLKELDVVPMSEEEAMPVKIQETIVYDYCEHMPEFPGGTEKLNEYLSENIQYPLAAMENGEQGKVLVRALIRDDGSIYTVELLHGEYPALNQEAMRVVESMPRFIPGTDGDGNPIDVWYTIPVTFKLKGSVDDDDDHE